MQVLCLVVVTYRVVRHCRANMKDFDFFYYAFHIGHLVCKMSFIFGILVLCFEANVE